MSNDLIERVARAIYTAEPTGLADGWDQERESVRESYRNEARSALGIVRNWLDDAGFGGAADHVDTELVKKP